MRVTNKKTIRTQQKLTEAKELYTTYFKRNNYNHLSTLKDLAANGYNHEYFRKRYTTSQCFMRHLCIDVKSYYLSGWKQWTPCVIEPFIKEYIMDIDEF